MKIQFNTDVHIGGTEALAAEVNIAVEPAPKPRRRITISCFLSGRADCPARTALYPRRIAASLRRNTP